MCRGAIGLLDAADWNFVGGIDQYLVACSWSWCPLSSLVIAEIDRFNPAFHVALELARPWRSRARAGDIYTSRRVQDPRSTDRTSRWSIRFRDCCG